MLYINKLLLEEMIANVESTMEECCGFLFGHETAENRMLTSTMPAKNVSSEDKHRRFEISPKEYLKAEDFAERHNMALLGIYHSHPNHPAIPSASDRMLAQPYFSYVILSVIDKRFSAIRSWRLSDDLQFTEEKSVII